MAEHIKFETDRLLHGGDYNPEQWLAYPEILEKDIELFKKAGINVVTVGMFSWSVLESEEGKYDLEWLLDIVERLYRNGIYTILGTPSGARPKWLAEKYPQVLRVDGQRRRALFGGRHNHCYTSPVYREKIWKIDKLLGEKIGNHSGVILLHISNEFGGECHCPLCQEAFRQWLKEKYGTIEELNRRWNTVFWSHTYQSFDQVESPSPRGESMLHALNLDWKRFVTHQTADFAEKEKEALQEGGCYKPVTLNFMDDFYGLNYRKFKDVIDVASWDSYPEWHRKPEKITAVETAMQHDFMRSLLKKPFLLMESSPSSTNWQDVSKLRKPGMIQAAALQAVAHGSDSALYFQMRQSRGASEKFHGAVIDHYGGEDTRVFREVSETGKALEQLREVAGTQVSSSAAIVYDTENRWALLDSQGPRNIGMPYRETSQKMYGAVRRQGLNTDVIDMEDSLEGYKIVLIPMPYLFRAGFEEKVRRFVEEGGIAIMTFWSGVVDDTDACFLGGTPWKLMDVFGLRSMEIDGLYEEESNGALPVQGNSLGLSRKYSCKNLCELVKVSDAEVLMEYEKDFYREMPVLTCRKYGKGKAYYVCADMEQEFYTDVLDKIVKQEKLEVPLKTIPEGIEVCTRESSEWIYTFVQNFAHHPVKISIEENAEKWFGGEENDRIPEYGTVVYRKRK